MEGVQYAKRGDYEKAILYYNRALEFDPKCSDAFVGRGAAFANQNMLEKAIVEFNRALSLNPEDKNAKLYLNATKLKVCIL